MDADHLSTLLTTSAAHLFACSNEMGGRIRITTPCLHPSGRPVEVWLVDGHYLTDAGRTIGRRKTISIVDLSLLKESLGHSGVQLQQGKLQAPFRAEQAARSVLRMAQAILQIEALLTGRESKLLRCGDLVMDPISRRVYCQERRVHLTPTEFDLLAYLLTRQGKLVSYEELLYIVWGKMSNRYRSRVRVRVHHLRQKVPQESVRIETVRGRGYLLRNLKRDT